MHAKPTVHIIDDDRAVRESLSFLLELEGFIAKTWASCAAFLRNASLDTNCCLLVDHHMPEMTGIALIEHLHREGIRIPTLLMTGLPSAGIRQGVEGLGAAILEKPFHISEIVQRIETLANRRGTEGVRERRDRSPSGLSKGRTAPNTGEPGLARSSMKRILAAVDGSTGSMKALDLATDLARTYHAELMLLAVAHHFPAPIEAAVEEFMRVEHLKAPLHDAAEAAAATVVAEGQLEARGKGVQRITKEVVLGDPAHEIIAVAKDREADLIVLGSRGYGRLVGLVLGSVAQKVLGHASCPVLVVR